MILAAMLINQKSERASSSRHALNLNLVAKRSLMTKGQTAFLEEDLAHLVVVGGDALETKTTVTLTMQTMARMRKMLQHLAGDVDVARSSSSRRKISRCLTLTLTLTCLTLTCLTLTLRKSFVQMEAMVRDAGVGGEGKRLIRLMRLR